MLTNKVEAIYALRDAAEEKGLAEAQLARDPHPAARDTLLDAQLRLEEKTQDAIEACHECGGNHAATQPHDGAAHGNVIDVQFGEKNDSA